MSASFGKEWLYKRLSTVLLAPVLMFLFACGGSETTATAPVIVEPTNSIPTISITPPQSTNIAENESISLTAQATDNEDGNLSANILWSSDTDGALGTGSNLDVVLSVGTHAITASVADSDGAEAKATLTISVVRTLGIASISWQAPTQNTNGTDLTDLTGFVVYYGEAPESLIHSQAVQDPNQYADVIEGLKFNTTYYFAVTAVNSLGIESDLSSTASKFISE
ncbi:MAG: fibronectin type III domain-containing protein [Kangiellaceae bacterium]|nr:fibronectin type III domain-containing protein [Kangiellaceae bacterium]MCW9015735.1 fibronectin type III domain-containing protein [Kangiellaceae bacterium]